MKQYAPLLFLVSVLAQPPKPSQYRSWASIFCGCVFLFLLGTKATSWGRGVFRFAFFFITSTYKLLYNFIFPPAADRRSSCFISYKYVFFSVFLILAILVVLVSISLLTNGFELLPSLLKVQSCPTFQFGLIFCSVSPKWEWCGS